MAQKQDIFWKLMPWHFAGTFGFLSQDLTVAGMVLVGFLLLNSIRS